MCEVSLTVCHLPVCIVLAFRMVLDLLFEIFAPIVLGTPVVFSVVLLLCLCLSLVCFSCFPCDESGTWICCILWWWGEKVTNFFFHWIFPTFFFFFFVLGLQVANPGRYGTSWYILWHGIFMRVSRTQCDIPSVLQWSQVVTYVMVIMSTTMCWLVMRWSLLVILLVVHHYKSVSYNNLPESGLARVLSTKYCESGAP